MEITSRARDPALVAYLSLLDESCSPNIQNLKLPETSITGRIKMSVFVHKQKHLDQSRWQDFYILVIRVSSRFPR
jgi:hypothetical protein